MKRGLVVGKFYPPHKGHKYLIDTALASVDKLVVGVVYRPDESISGEQRRQWVQAIHPNAEVVAMPDIGNDDDSQAWADYTVEFLGYIPDVVFTSETYGDTWAECLGCEHVLVDIDRKRLPVSATKIRSDPYAYWEFLEPVVQAYFVKRICIVGAESSGTTTLSKDLAKHYSTAWVMEYGRYYSESKLYSEGPWKWQLEEFEHIASVQNQWEDQMARHANRFLICDTDSFATSIWQERLAGSVSEQVKRSYKKRRYDLYILTAPDIPFEQDGMREGGAARLQMHERFLEQLDILGKKYIVVNGSRNRRLIDAIKACEEIRPNRAAVADVKNLPMPKIPVLEPTVQLFSK